MLISELFDIYIERLSCRGCSKRTLDNYRYARKLIIDYFGDIPVRKITFGENQGFSLSLFGVLAPATVRLILIEWRAVLINSKIKLKFDPYQIGIPRRPKSSPLFLTEREAVAFIQAVATPRRAYSNWTRLRNTLIVIILYQTGLRVGELVALNRGDLARQEIVIVGKSKNPRVVFTTPDIEVFYRRWLGTRTDNSPALFISKSGRRLTAADVRAVFRAQCRYWGFGRIHPHTLRHSCATTLLEKGMELRYIAELLGHENLDTTKLYTHVSNPKLAREFRSFTPNIGIVENFK